MRTFTLDNSAPGDGFESQTRILVVYQQKDGWEKVESMPHGMQANIAPVDRIRNWEVFLALPILDKKKIVRELCN